MPSSTAWPSPSQNTEAFSRPGTLPSAWPPATQTNQNPWAPDDTKGSSSSNTGTNTPTSHTNWPPAISPNGNGATQWPAAVQPGFGQQQPSSWPSTDARPGGHSSGATGATGAAEQGAQSRTSKQTKTNPFAASSPTPGKLKGPDSSSSAPGAPGAPGTPASSHETAYPAFSDAGQWHGQDIPPEPALAQSRSGSQSSKPELNPFVKGDPSDQKPKNPFSPRARARGLVQAAAPPSLPWPASLSGQGGGFSAGITDAGQQASARAGTMASNAAASAAGVARKAKAAGQAAVSAGPWPGEHEHGEAIITD